MIVRISAILATLVLSGVAAATAQVSTSIDICEAIDTSGSISDANLDLEIRGFQAAFDDVLVPEVDAGRAIGLAIVGFSTDVQTFLPLTRIDGNRNDIRAAYDAVGETTDRELTNLSGALERCTSLLSASTADRRVIDLSTDGQPTANDTNADVIQAANQAKSAGIEIWTLGVGSGVDTDLLESIVGCPSSTTNCLAAHFEVMSFQDFPEVLRQKTGEIANGGNGDGNGNGDGDGDNRPPNADPDSARTDVDVPVTIRVLDNDSDPDTDPLSIQSLGDPAHGSAVANDNGTITYTPDPGFRGTDQFAYTVSDGHGGTASALVGIGIDVDPPDVDDGDGGNGPTGVPGLTPPWLGLLGAGLLLLMGRELWLRTRISNAN